MLTIPQKVALCNLLQDEIARHPDASHRWLPILGTIAKDLRQHRLAIQRAKDRNAAKQSRRTQRGPILARKTTFATRTPAR